MKKAAARFKKGVFSVFVIFLLPIVTVKAQVDVISAFRIKWENSKPYLLKMAKKMPAEHYNFQPRERQMSFQEQLLHIRDNMLMLSKRYIAGTSYNDTLKNPQALTKQETIQQLSNAFDEVNRIVSNMDKDDLSTQVDFFAGPKTKLQILNIIQDHVTHHRGQLIVYLNLKGIKPPEYVGW